MIGEYWTPHEFYEDAGRVEAQQRKRQQELRRQMTPLTYAVRSSRAADMYPGLSSGVLAALGITGVDPTDPLYASISAQDLIAQMQESATGSTSPGEVESAEEIARTVNPDGIASGQLPANDQQPWISKLTASDSWWQRLLGAPLNGIQSAVQATILFSQAGYDLSFGYRAFAEAALERNPDATILNPIQTMRNRTLGIETPEGTIEAPIPVFMRMVGEAVEGRPVNVGDTWFLASGNLSAETQRRLEAGLDFEVAIDNAEQRELGVPLGYEYNAKKAAFPFRFRNGEEVPNSFGASVVTDIFDANNWAAKATSVVVDLGTGLASDPLTYIGGITGAARTASTRILATGTRGMGMSMSQYLRTPGAARALAGIRSIADNPMAINRAIGRATRVSDPSVAHAISVAAKSGDDTLRSLLIDLADRGAIANTLEPISLSGYAMRKMFLRGLRDDGSASAVSRMSGAILEATSGSNVVPTVGAALAGLGIRSQAATTMRHVGSIGGGWIGLKHGIDYRPGFARLVGSVARTLPVGNGAEFVSRLDDYARSFGLDIDQRNDLFNRAVLQPEIRATMPMVATVDDWAKRQIAQGDMALAEVYDDLLFGGGMNSENPINIVRGVYRHFADNAAKATGMGAKEQNHLNSLLGRIFETTEDMRKYALELSGDNMLHPGAKVLVNDVKAGKRYVTATPQEISEALAFNIPLMETRQVRMLLRRGGQMGLFGRLGRRLNLLSADGVAGGRVLSLADHIKKGLDVDAAPLVAAIKENRVRKNILAANSIQDLSPATIRRLEQAGLDPDDFQRIKDTAQAYDSVFSDAADEGLLDDLLAEVDGDEVVFLDSEGRDILEALSDVPVQRRNLPESVKTLYAGSYNASETLIKSLTNLQSGLWKPLVMLRPAYIFRVIGEEQVRMWFNGYRSVLNSPLSFMALAMASRSRDPKKIARVGRIFGLGPETAAGKLDDIEEFLARTFGVARKDLDGHYLSMTEDFRDAMYRGRFNALMRGEPETYLGAFEEVPFQRVGNRVTDETVNALAYDVLEASDRPMARLAAAAIFLDNHPLGPEEAKRLLLNSDDYALLRAAWRWAGSPEPEATTAYRFGDRGLTKAVMDAFVGDVSSPLFQYRAQVARTSEQLRGAVTNPTLARQQAESYFARAFNTIGARYVRRGINGEGMVLNTGQAAEGVLDPVIMDSVMRQASQWPHERWWMMESEEIAGPVGMMQPTPIGMFDYPESVLDEFALEGGVERVLLTGSPDPGVVTVNKVNASNEVIMQANVRVRSTPDGVQVVGIDSIRTSFYDDFSVGDTIMEAINHVDPGFAARTTVGDFLDTQVSGRPLYEWFDDLNISTGVVGVEEFTGNPRWAKSSVDEILQRKIEGTDVRFIDYLTDPERFGMLPDELQAKLLSRRPDLVVDDGDVLRTANGDYAVIEIGDGRILDIDADGNLQVRDTPEARTFDPEIDVDVKVQTEGPVSAGPTTTRIDDVVDADSTGPTTEYFDDAEALADEISGPVTPEAPPIERELAGGVDEGDFLDLDRYPENANALIRRRRAVIERRGQSFTMTSVGPKQMEIIEDIIQSVDPRLSYGVQITGPRSVLVEDKQALLNALDEYGGGNARSLARLRASVESAAGDKNPSLGVRRLRADERGPLYAGVSRDPETNRPLLGTIPASEIDEDVLGMLDAVEARRRSVEQHTSNKGGVVTKDLKRAGFTDEQIEAIGPTPKTFEGPIPDLVQRRVEGDLVRTSILSEDMTMAMQAILASDNPAWNASWELVEQGHRSYLRIYDAEQFDQLLDHVWRNKGDEWAEALNQPWRDDVLGTVEPRRITKSAREAHLARAAEGDRRYKPLPDSLQKYKTDAEYRVGGVYADDEMLLRQEALQRMDRLEEATRESSEVLDGAQSWFRGKKAADYKPQFIDDLTPEQAEGLARIGWREGKSAETTQIDLPQGLIPRAGTLTKYRVGLRRVGRDKRVVAEVADVDEAIARTRYHMDRLSDQGSRPGTASEMGKMYDSLAAWLRWLEDNRDSLPRRTLTPPEGTFTAAKRQLADMRGTNDATLAMIERERTVVSIIDEELANAQKAAREEVTEAFTAVAEGTMERNPVGLTALRSQPRMPRHFEMVSRYIEDIERQIDEAVVKPRQSVVRLGRSPLEEMVEVPTGRFNVEIYDATSGERVAFVAKELDEARAIEVAARAMEDRAVSRRTTTGPFRNYKYRVREQMEVRVRNDAMEQALSVEDALQPQYADEVLPGEAAAQTPEAPPAAPPDEGLADEIAALESELGMSPAPAAEGADTMADLPDVDRSVANRNIREADVEGIFEIDVPENARDLVNRVVPEVDMGEAGDLVIRNYDVDDIADALDDAAQTGYERGFVEKFRRHLKRDTDLDADLPRSSAEHTYRQPEAVADEAVEATEALPSSTSNRTLTGTLSHGGHKIKVDGNELKSPLISTKRPVEVEEALGLRTLRLADEQGAPLTVKLSRPSDARLEQYAALGFTDEVGRTKTTVTLRRNPNTPLPESWPRGTGQPLEADGLTGWVGFDAEGNLVANGASRDEVVERVGSMVEADVTARGDLTKDDIAEIFRTMHESNPHRLASPDDVREALNRSGQSLLESRFKPRPGFTEAGEYVGPPRGVPRGYESVESGPVHYFPLSNEAHEWDMNLLELMATGKAYGDVPDEVLDDMVIDPLTGRQIEFDLDQMRQDAVNPRGKQRVENEMGPWLRQRSQIENWVPEQGKGRAVMRRPVMGHEGDPSRMQQIIESGFDIITARPANLLSRGPVWHDAYVEAIAELYPFASNQARQEIIDYLRGEGLHGKNNEVWNLVASLLGKRKDMSDEAIERMLLSQAREVQRVGFAKVARVEIDDMAGVGAARRGIESAEEVLMLSQQIAAERVKALLFDAAQRNQFFDQAAIIFPFGDAFAELLQRWSRAFTTSPYRTRNLARTGQVAKALNGGLYDDDGVYSQDAGLRYTDPYSGEDMILLPGSELVSRMVTGDPNQMRMGLNAGGLSPLSVSAIPGLGPVVTTTAGVFGRFLGDLNPADPFQNPWLYRQLFPYGLYDPSTSGEGIGAAAQATLGFPGWLNRLSTGVLNSFGDVAMARFGTASGQRSLDNTASEILRVNAATGRWSLDTPQAQSEAAQEAFMHATRIEMIRGLALGLFGANAPSFTIPHINRDDLASATDDEIHETLTYLAPVAYARIYQTMLDENDGDFLKTAVEFENKYGFSSAYVRTGKSVEVRPSPVTREGRLFFNENPDMVAAYPLAAYYLQPDPPSSEFNYDAFRLGIVNGDRETIDPREYAYLLNNAVGLVEYQRKTDLILQAQAAGEISSTQAAEMQREVRLQTERDFPGFNQTPSANKPDPQDVARQLDQMVENEPNLDRFPMGPIIREAVELTRGASFVSRDSGHGEWWWTSSPHPVAMEIRTSFRAAFEGLTRRDPRAAVLWNEVYSRIIPYGEPSRLKIIPDDPYFGTFFEEDDYEVPPDDIDVPEAEVRQP